jgi:hypothetical protein
VDNPPPAGLQHESLAGATRLESASRHAADLGHPLSPPPQPGTPCSGGSDRRMNAVSSTKNQRHFDLPGLLDLSGIREQPAAKRPCSYSPTD